jgi:hypothetical protein
MLFRTAPALTIRRSRFSALLSLRRRFACIFLVIGALSDLPSRGYAAALECPETGSAGPVSQLLTEPQRKLMASGNTADLTKEILDLINRLQIEKPNIAYAELTDTLIAAVCPVVASLPNLTAIEKWRRMRQFDAILQKQLAADAMPQGSLIIANVPLPPAVYAELRSQAATAGQSPAQLMAAILSRAAGK